MKKDKWADVIALLIIFATIAVTLFCAKWFFEAVYYSDMPEWLKYVLLR